MPHPATRRGRRASRARRHWFCTMLCHRCRSMPLMRRFLATRRRLSTALCASVATVSGSAFPPAAGQSTTKRFSDHAARGEHAMKIQEVWVDRGDFRRARVVDTTLPAPAEGEVLVAIESFALTANNVSYALSGDMIGYWGYFPAQEHWGKVPAWGYARVLVSRCEGVAEGERLWGFLPLATHVLLQPGHVSARGMVDVAGHRAALPALY